MAERMSSEMVPGESSDAAIILSDVGAMSSATGLVPSSSRPQPVALVDLVSSGQLELCDLDGNSGGGLLEGVGIVASNGCNGGRRGVLIIESVRAMGVLDARSSDSGSGMEMRGGRKEAGVTRMRRRKSWSDDRKGGDWCAGCGAVCP